MKILRVVSCCLLSARCVVESAVTKEVVGGQVTVGCSFTLAGNNNKYFCKGTCSGKDILVETKGIKNASQDRYSIEDKGDVFYATIKDLRKSDSGTYWCGVDRTIKDTFQEVRLIVTDAPPIPTPSPLTSRPHVSTTLPNLSTTSPYTSTTLPNLSTTSPYTSTTLPNLTTSSNPSTTFLASGDVSGRLSRAGLMVWTSAGLVVMVTVLGLVLLLFYRQRRGTRRTPPPPPPVSSNTQPDPTGEVDCVYEEIREADRQTDTLPVVISSVYSTVSASSTSSATDSRVYSRPPTASGTQDDSIYSTAQLPKDTVESTRFPAVHLFKDSPEDALYSTAQLPKIM
ncbi:CMRF35-like molecule 3 isoform X2 [Salmo trutta]|uniref:CMRF35-like molecule 3 isoform X2 n=1 Tax=Salmo trutta TaxID=8032 RepID=UPI00112FF437|nr:CMRF35-like molecule 3 isoform X2 [Salmo trutta]